MVQVTVEGHTGGLYCCSTNSCNTPAMVPQLPPPQICYKNMHHWGRDLNIGAGQCTLNKLLFVSVQHEL